MRPEFLTERERRSRSDRNPVATARIDQLARGVHALGPQPICARTFS